MKPAKKRHTQIRALHEVSKESIFTSASAGGVPLSAEDLAAAEESMAVQESRHHLKVKAGMKKFPFTQTQLDENRVMRYFSKDLADSELIWHRDRESRVVRMVEGKGWYLQLDGKLPKPIRLGESYRIPAGNWHRLIRRPDSSNLTVIVEKMKKGDQVTHKGKKATIKVPDARGPFIGIDPAGPDDMKMVPGDEIDEPKKGKKNEIARVMDEALDDLLSDVLHEKKGKKGLWANVHAKRKCGESPA